MYGKARAGSELQVGVLQLDELKGGEMNLEQRFGWGERTLVGTGRLGIVKRMF